MWQETFQFLSDVIFRMFFGEEITIDLNFWLSQGSAATYWRYGGKYYVVLFEIYFSFQHWKNVENPLRIDKVTATSLVWIVYNFYN